jgi:hypothetical protein
MPTPRFATAPAIAAPAQASTNRAAGDLTGMILPGVLMLLGVAVTAAWIRVGHWPRSTATAPPDRAAGRLPIAGAARRRRPAPGSAGRGERDRPHAAAPAAPGHGTLLPVDWRPRIGELVRVQQQLHELDVAGLRKWSQPAVAATEERLAAVEAALGEALDPAYRSFLARADGWDGFLQDTDLFGSEDLLGNERFASAVDRLGDLEAVVLDQAGVARDQLLPIAASANDLDVVVITRRSAAQPGTVIWFAECEIDRFPDFGEYLASTVEYNRLELDHFRRHADEIAGLGT